MEDRLIYTVQEVASILHSSPNYIYELIRKGYLPAIKLGSLKVLKSTLERFLIQNEGKDLSDLKESISNNNYKINSKALSMSLIKYIERK